MHEIDRPDLVEVRGAPQDLLKARRHMSVRPAREIPAQRAVNPIHTVVIPWMAIQAHPVVVRPEAPALMRRHQVLQDINHGRVPHRWIDQRVVMRRARQPDDAARATDREPMLSRQDFDHLTTRGGRYSFRPSTSLMAAFPSARSAYIRLSFAFSASRLFMRRRSATVAPAYFDFQLKYAARLKGAVAGVAARALPDLPARYRNHTVVRAVFVPETQRQTRIGDVAVVSLRHLLGTPTGYDSQAMSRTAHPTKTDKGKPAAVAANADKIDPVADNREATFDYLFLDQFEAGIVLLGTEVGDVPSAVEIQRRLK